MVKRLALKLVLDIVDGCSVQYCGGTVLYFLSILAHDYQIIYDRAVQATGHGKCSVDALNGIDKALLTSAVNAQTAIKSSAETDDIIVPKMELWQVDEHGKRVSFAAWAYKQLTDRERLSGVYWRKKRISNKIDRSSKNAATTFVMQRMTNTTEFC